jgi:hypothetical protein
MPEATLCKFCKITMNHRDSGIVIVIPNTHLANIDKIRDKYIQL